jgi:hypothetical protein
LDIIKLKWLIYQDTFDNPNYDEIYIKKFNELIAVPGLYLNKKWNELDKDEQIRFSTRWETFLTMVISNKTLIRNSYFHMLKSIIIFFERHYEKINFVVKNYNYNQITSDSNLNIIDSEFAPQFFKLLPVLFSMTGAFCAFFFYTFSSKELYSLKTSSVGKKIYNFLNKKNPHSFCGTRAASWPWGRRTACRRWRRAGRSTSRRRRG